jgi:uncharacterized protein
MRGRVAIDLDALDNYLLSDHSPVDCMGLSDLDGLLTAIVIGPGLVLPTEWLQVIWGDVEPQFANEAEKQTVLGLIMGRYNEIVTCFMSDPEGFEPLFLEGSDGEVIASDWAAGFLDAVALRRKAWEPLIKHHRGRMMIMPILLLSGDAKLDGGSDGVVREDEFLAEVPDIVPACVAAIHRFWKSYRADRKVPSSQRRSRPVVTDADKLRPVSVAAISFALDD